MGTVIDDNCVVHQTRLEAIEAKFCAQFGYAGRGYLSEEVNRNISNRKWSYICALTSPCKIHHSPSYTFCPPWDQITQTSTTPEWKHELSTVQRFSDRSKKKIIIKTWVWIHYFVHMQSKWDGPLAKYQAQANVLRKYI